MKAAVDEGEKRPSTAVLWDAIQHYGKPLMFVRGMRKQSVVSDEDEAELRKRASSVRVEHVQEAGHSVQGDTPLELAALIQDFIKN
jgi:pimeloyl-ACP methyl ester carboxylesterase